MITYYISSSQGKWALMVESLVDIEMLKEVFSSAEALYSADMDKGPDYHAEPYHTYLKAQLIEWGINYSALLQLNITVRV